MGKNKPCRNGYYHYMLEFKAKIKDKAKYEHDTIGLSNLIGEQWARLTPEERRPYEEKAKTDKNNRVVKYTTTGVNIEIVQQRECERLAKEQRMKDDISQTVRMAVETGHITEQIFYLIHINYFCMEASTKRYIPAEIAASRFTLGEGVISDYVFHMICHPGRMPVGYSYQAVSHSKDTHQLEPPMGDDNEVNLREVIDSFRNYMMELNSDDQSPPPVYAEAKNKEVVENVLSNLCMENGYREDLFKVYSIEFLFLTLRNNCGRDTVWASLSNSILELEKDKYDFCTEIPCAIHEASDVPNHCSRSHVIRVAYVICDNCCGDLNIELIPGQHVPRRSKLAGMRAPSVASNFGSASSVATVKPSTSYRHNNYANGNYLSQRTESVASAMSETSSVSDPNDFAALGGYDTDFSQQLDTDDWVLPKQRSKRDNYKKNASQSSATSSKAPELNFTYPSGSSQSQPSQTQPSQSQSSQSQPSQSQPCRRPATLSAALTQMSVSPRPPSTNSIGRGRGRGIAANFNKKMI